MRNGLLASAVGVFVSAFLWLLSFKIVAYWMGPEGVGLFSQLRQVAQAATIGATFGGSNSVVQGLAERQDEITRLHFRAMAARFVGTASVGMVLAIFFMAPQLTQFFLSSDTPSLIVTVRWIALAVLLNVGGTYALAVLIGYRSYFYLALAQIAGPAMLVMLLAVALCFRLSPNPQFLAWAFVLCFGVSCLVGAFGISKLPKHVAISQAPGLSWEQGYAYLRFALSNLLAALSATIALLLIRSWVIEAKGLAFAGLFDAGWTLTFNYTTLFLTACSAIYLPLLTAASRPESQKVYMLKTAYLVLGTSILICHSMVLFKETLINLLYSPQFQASGQVLTVLVIAVIFRGASWVYGTMILSERNSGVLLVSDLSLNLSLLVAVRYALDYFASLDALSWAFVLPNFLYLIFVVEYACKKNKLMRRRQIWPLLLAGTLPLFYMALVPDSMLGARPEIAAWLCMAFGLAVSGAALFAYKKVIS